MRLTRWDQELTTSQTNEVLFHLSRWHLAQCSDEDQVNDIARFVEQKDVASLCHFSLSYPGLSVRSVRHLRQILAFFSKRKDVDIGLDTRTVAWEKAKEAEALCKQTNELFRLYNQGGFYFPLDVESVLYRAQRKICTVLGDLPSLEQLKLRFGPGATTQVKKKDASVRRKLSQVLACSGDASGIISDLLAELPVWAGLEPAADSVTCQVEIHLGVMDFVPKNAKTDRTVSKVPMLNTLGQLGIGDFMGTRLRLEGVNIKDQTLNQRLAREGSITGALATLDLSSASDTIATQFVMSMLPLDWFLFLSALRTGSEIGPEGPIRLEKFASMGNGFTFPLETLLFYALAYGCVEESDRTKVNVYGDDIIVPTYAAPLLIRVLTSCGFIVNKEKSYVSGNFRESCGKDYLSGIDVRPCYVKDTLSGAQCFVLYNFYIRTEQPGPASLLLEFLDEDLRLWGPDGFGDGHLLGDNVTYKDHKRIDGWGGFTFETYTWKSRKAYYRLGADYVFPSYSIYAKEGPELGFLEDSKEASGFLRTRRSLGALRPERSDSVYSLVPGKGREKEWMLQDTLPGVEGYKRIKIYTFAK